MAQGPGPFLASESMWLVSSPGLTSAPRAPSKVSKAWGWCHQKRAAESPGTPGGHTLPLPTTIPELWCRWLHCTQGWASSGSGAIDKLGGLPSLAERPPPSQASLRASLRRLSGPQPQYDGASRRRLLSHHQHTEAQASGHILCQHRPLAQLPAPGSHARFTGDSCPKHLLRGLLPGGTSLLCGSTRPAVLGHSCPVRGPGHTPLPNSMLPTILGPAGTPGAHKPFMAFVLVSPWLPNTYLPRVETSAQD